MAPRSVSFISFCAVNVLIDVESLYNLMHHRFPVHAFFHTYVGASIAAIATVLLFMALQWFASRFWLPNVFSWQSLCTKQVAIGAILGAYSHVLFDSIMHSDISPLAPFSNANGLHGALSVLELHLLCLALAAFGLAIVSLRHIHKDEDRQR